MLGRRVLSVLCGAVVVAAGIGLAPPALARSTTVDLAGARIDDDGWIWQPQTCSESGRCTIKGSGVAYWSGVISGMSEYTAYASYDPSTNLLTNDTWEWFTVTISGCGSGRFLTHQHSTYTGADVVMMQDPTTGKFQAGDGTWDYVAGTGTGAFAKLKSLTFTVKHIEFYPVTFENHETVTSGRAVCG